MSVNLFLTNQPITLAGHEYLLANFHRVGPAEAAATIGGAGVTNDSPWTNSSGGQTVEWISRPLSSTKFAAWSFTANLLTPRHYHAGVGDQTATLISAGQKREYVPPFFTPIASCELFNTDTWTTSVPLLQTLRNHCMSGAPTAALVFGGFGADTPLLPDYPPGGIVVDGTLTTEEFNGITWTNRALMPIDHDSAAGCGTVSASFCCGGNVNNISYNTDGFETTASTPADSIYLYNNDVWISAGNLSHVRYAGIAVGTTTSTLIFGGQDPNLDDGPALDYVESFNGTVATVGPNMQLPRFYHSGCGTATAALAAGGYSNNYYTHISAETFNGISWTAMQNMPYASVYSAGSGSKSSALIAGGDNDGSRVFDVCLLLTEKSIDYIDFSEKLLMNYWGASDDETMNAGVNWSVYAWSASGNVITENLITEFSWQPTIWAVTGNMVTGRQWAVGCGSANASLNFNGWQLTAVDGYSNIITAGIVVAGTESFDGTLWTSLANTSVGKWSAGGCGTQTAAVNFGGVTSTFDWNGQSYYNTYDSGARLTLTELFDGATWATSGNMLVATGGVSGCGTTSAALCAGGQFDRGSGESSELFNGAVWASGPASITPRYAFGLCGTATSALNAGGTDFQQNIFSILCESFNGAAWSAQPNIGIPRVGLGLSGSENSAECAGGIINFYYNDIYTWGDMPGFVHAVAGTQTEIFNGSSWAFAGNLNVGRFASCSSGGVGAGLSIGGIQNQDNSSLVCNVTEASTYNKFKLTQKNYSAASYSTAWSLSGNLIAPTEYHAAAGTPAAGLMFGGSITGLVVATQQCEKFNSGAWSTAANLITATTYNAGCGSQTAAVCISGAATSNTTTAVTEKFNGTIWSASGNVITARATAVSFGTQTAAVLFGGKGPAVNTVTLATELFDGTSWSSAGNILTPRQYSAGCGLQSSGISAGGDWSTNAFSASTGIYWNTLNTTEYFNGSVWTVRATLNNPRMDHSMSGQSDSAIAVSGTSLFGWNSYEASTEVYNGSVWIVNSNCLQPSGSHAGAGSQSNCFKCGGYRGSVVNDTSAGQYSDINMNTTEIYNQMTVNIGTRLSIKATLTNGGNTALSPGISKTASIYYNSGDENMPGDSYFTILSYLPHRRITSAT